MQTLTVTLAGTWARGLREQTLSPGRARGPAYGHSPEPRATPRSRGCLNRPSSPPARWSARGAGPAAELGFSVRQHGWFNGLKFAGPTPTPLQGPTQAHLHGLSTLCHPCMPTLPPRPTEPGLQLLPPIVEGQEAQPASQGWSVPKQDARRLGC